MNIKCIRNYQEFGDSEEKGKKHLRYNSRRQMQVCLFWIEKFSEIKQPHKTVDRAHTLAHVHTR